MSCSRDHRAFQDGVSAAIRAHAEASRWCGRVPSFERQVEDATFARGVLDGPLGSDGVDPFALTNARSDARGDEGAAEWDPVVAPSDCEDTCRVKQPAMVPRWSDGQRSFRMSTSVRERALSVVTIRTGTNPEGLLSEAFMIESAWVILYENRDLAYWAESLLTGDEPSECLRIAIEGAEAITPEDVDVGPIEIEVRGSFGEGWPTNYCNEDGSGRFFMYGTAADRKVLICRNSAMWPEFVCAWQRREYASRQCMALWLASRILHELTHVCGHSMWPWHDDIWFEHSDCDFARRISSMFGWAVAERWKRRGWDLGWELGRDGCFYGEDDFCSSDGLPWPRYGGC
jgi:hypothetical protein